MTKLENGYTKISNEILEKAATTKLNGTQFRILMTVWRATYGWNKKEHEISETYLAKATGIHKQQIKRELKTLIDKDIITVIKEPTFTCGRVLGFNKNYVNSPQVTKKIPPNEIDTTTGSELDTPTGSGLDTQKRNIKKQYKYSDVFNYYLTLDLVKHRTFTKAMTTAFNKAEKELSIDNEQMKRMLKRHKEKVVSSAKSKYPVKARPLHVFFGQKKVGSSNLICSDYLDEVWIETGNKNQMPKQALKFKEHDFI